MTETTTWLDIMPALPLAQNVPVLSNLWNGWGPGVVRYTRAAGEIDYLEYGEQPGAGVSFDALDGEPVEVPIEALRVDLGEPLGFAYALRWWRLNAILPTQLGQVAAADMARRWLLNAITDEDRIALARALQEVATKPPDPLLP